MDRSDVITLVKEHMSTDSIGQQIATDTSRDVFCNVGSITQSEFYEAGRSGLNPDYKVTMDRWEYDGEDICVLHGIRYGIYRTYITKGEAIELYLSRKGGV